MNEEKKEIDISSLIEHMVGVEKIIKKYEFITREIILINAEIKEIKLSLKKITDKISVEKDDNNKLNES